MASDSVTYTKKVVIAASISVAFVAALLFFRAVTTTLLILFAGILLAVFLSGCAKLLARWTPLSRTAGLWVTVVLILAFFVGIFWVAGPRIAEQSDQLAERMPRILADLRARVAGLPGGSILLESVPGSGEGSSGVSTSRITGAFSTALGGLTNVALILVLGLYLAVNPRLYWKGLVRLIPQHHQDRGRDVLSVLDRALRLWLAGRIASMAVVGLLTAIGLWIIGVPLALVLGIIAALFAFIPYIGPILGLLPALLVALSEGTTLALYVVLVFIAVQLLESNLITPLIQQRVVSLPPALLIAAQVLMGVVAGAFGVLVASPLTVVIIVLVQMLYLENALAEQVDVMGRHPNAESGTS